jgi:hypothetical protein
MRIMKHYGAAPDHLHFVDLATYCLLQVLGPDGGWSDVATDDDWSTH